VDVLNKEKGFSQLSVDKSF